MPTIFEIGKGKLVIEVRTKEMGHNRPHVHAVAPGADCSISIDATVEVLATSGFNQPTVNRLVEFVKANKAKCVEEWNAYHPNKEI
jgi:hypothetical protein